MTKLKTKSSPTTPNPVGKDLSAFRAAHDKSFFVPKKILEGIQKLGNDQWEYEAPFIKLAGISVTDLALFRDQFADYIVEVRDRNSKNGKRIWCGSKSLATKLRAMV